MQQAVETAQVDERAVFGQVLHHACEHRPFFEVLQSLGTLFVLLAFEQVFARDHNVAALLIQLDDGDFIAVAKRAAENAADGKTAQIFAVVEIAHLKLQDGVGVALGSGNVLQNRIEQNL